MDLPALFDAHHAGLFRFAYRMTGSASDAEDIVQECFLALLRPGNRFDPNRATLRSYLYGAVRNQALKRQATAPPSTAEPSTARSPESQILGAETPGRGRGGCAAAPTGTARGSGARPL